MKQLLIVSLLLVMVGCATFDREPRIDIEYKDVLIPVSSVPEPPNTDCPPDALLELNQSATDGELVKAYRIAILQLRDCSDLREKVIAKYRKMAKEDGKRIDDLPTSMSAGPLSMGGPLSSAVPSIPMSELDKAFADFEAAVNVATNTLKQQVNDKYNKGTGPVSSSGPVVSTHADDNRIIGEFNFPTDALNAELGINDGTVSMGGPMSSSPPVSDGAFGNIESEFGDLNNKKYDIE